MIKTRKCLRFSKKQSGWYGVVKLTPIIVNSPDDEKVISVIRNLKNELSRDEAKVVLTPSVNGYKCRIYISGEDVLAFLVFRVSEAIQICYLFKDNA